MEAVNRLGYKTQIDHHGPVQEGWGSPDISIHNGWRGSTAARFLFPAMKRPNLTVITGALATRVEVHAGRAVALHYRQGGQDHCLEAAREIVLSGGAYNTPQLLLLSGIGPADELRELGVNVVHDLPGVGRNLQDHPSIAMVWSAERAVTLTNDLRFDRLTLSVLEWALTGKGRIANMPVTANGFVKTRPELERPDAQCLFQPTSILARPWFPAVKKARGRRGGDGLRPAAPRRPRLGQAGLGRSRAAAAHPHQRAVDRKRPRVLPPGDPADARESSPPRRSPTWSRPS
jgi:choline dehydrogenase